MNKALLAVGIPNDKKNCQFISFLQIKVPFLYFTRIKETKTVVTLIIYAPCPGGGASWRNIRTLNQIINTHCQCQLLNVIQCYTMMYNDAI